MLEKENCCDWLNSKRIITHIKNHSVSLAVCANECTRVRVSDWARITVISLRGNGKKARRRLKANVSVWKRKYDCNQIFTFSQKAQFSNRQQHIDTYIQTLSLHTFYCHNIYINTENTEEGYESYNTYIPTHIQVYSICMYFI